MKDLIIEIRKSNYQDKNQLINTLKNKRHLINIDDNTLYDVVRIIIRKNYDYEESLKVASSLYNDLMVNNQTYNYFLNIFEDYPNIDITNIKQLFKLFSLFSDKNSLMYIIDNLKDNISIVNVIYDYIIQARRYYVDENAFVSKVMVLINDLKDNNNDEIIKYHLEEDRQQAGIYSLDRELIKINRIKEELDNIEKRQLIIQNNINDIKNDKKQVVNKTEKLDNKTNTKLESNIELQYNKFIHNNLFEFNIYDYEDVIKDKIKNLLVNNSISELSEIQFNNIKYYIEALVNDNMYIYEKLLYYGVTLSSFMFDKIFIDSFSNKDEWIEILREQSDFNISVISNIYNENYFYVKPIIDILLINKKFEFNEEFCTYNKISTAINLFGIDDLALNPIIVKNISMLSLEQYDTYKKIYVNHPQFYVFSSLLIYENDIFSLQEISFLPKSQEYKLWWYCYYILNDNISNKNINHDQKIAVRKIVYSSLEYDYSEFKILESYFNELVFLLTQKDISFVKIMKYNNKEKLFNYIHELISYNEEDNFKAKMLDRKVKLLIKKVNNTKE